MERSHEYHVTIIRRRKLANGEGEHSGSFIPATTTENYRDRARFERNATYNAINTHKRYTCLPENFTSPQRDLDALKLMRFH